MRMMRYSKPWFSGEYHTVKGQVFRTDAAGKKHVVYTLSGKWTGQIEATNVETGQRAVLIDIATTPASQEITPPVEELGELESRKVWHKTSIALNAQDYGVAMKEKTIVEEAQRALRKQREADGEVWKPKYFSQVTNPDDILEGYDRKKEDKVVCYFVHHDFPPYK